MGVCANAPMVQIWKDTYEDLTPALFEQLLEARLQNLFHQAQELELSTERFSVVAVHQFRYAFTQLLGDPDTCHLLLQAGPAEADGPVDRVLRPLMLGKFSDAVATGDLRSSNLDLLYAAYFGLVVGAMDHLLQLNPPLPPEQGAEQVTELCCSLLQIPYQPPA